MFVCLYMQAKYIAPYFGSRNDSQSFCILSTTLVAVQLTIASLSTNSLC